MMVLLIGWNVACPAEKLVMGVPFYSRPSEVPYRKIVESGSKCGSIR